MLLEVEGVSISFSFAGRTTSRGTVPIPTFGGAPTAPWPRAPTRSFAAGPAAAPTAAASSGAAASRADPTRT